MKSSKQKRAELKLERKAKSEKRKLRARATRFPIGSSAPVSVGEAPCNPTALAPSNSYGTPDFVRRGYYIDMAFTCKGCGKHEVWTATQQKWWYEVAKGGQDKIAVRCRPCRAKERARKNEARRVHLEGLTKKAAARTKKT